MNRPLAFKPFVVGIGASAGGLEALTQFIGGLPIDLGCIYVIAQHVSPNHRSLMAEILARETLASVRELVDRDKPEPNVIYIIPPGSNLVFNGERFHLIKASPEVAPKPSINILFQSIAEEFGDRAIGIILSGTGSDGTRGLRSIKAVGGVGFVQIPETAKYDGMPRSAIDACVADWILAPDQMGRELQRLVRFPNAIDELVSGEQRPADLTLLFDKVRQKTKIDFSCYKLPTVLRRLQRRMIATDCQSLAAYLVKAEANPEEFDTLAKETLISVTEFFRDKDAFRTLRRYARDIVDRKFPGDEIRVWVAGCATGEEAYSLAIVFLELIAARGIECRLRIFATDIDNNALGVARLGIYNRAAIEEVPSEYIDPYFIATGNGFEPVKAVRDAVTFARQDLTSDPPFLRVDLATCRNVMIYFNNELQAKVLSILRYALRDDGLLFLGRSESAGQQEALFAVADRRARIYKPRGQSRPISMGKLVRGPLSGPLTELRAPERASERIFLNAVADRFGPAMLIDSNCRILHSHGAVTPLMHFPAGSPEMNLAQLIVPELGNEILTTLHRAQRRQETAYSRRRRIATLDQQPWRLAIHPIAGAAASSFYLVVFEGPNAAVSHASPDISPDAPPEPVDNAIVDELASTREHLNTLMEEMAASNEEMQALNEEVQAANEELQATNEELEAANEEMQATNAELVSVNEESHTKSAELAAINSDFESVYNTIDFPIMVFGSDLCLKRVNAAAVRAYNLPLSAAGLPVSLLQLPASFGDIERRLTAMLTEQRKEKFLITDDGRHYQVFLTPSINKTGNTQSIVVFVTDLSDLMDAQQQIRSSQERLLSIMNHSTSAVAMKDSSGRYEFINRKFEQLFGVSEGATIGKTDLQLFDAEIARQLRGDDLEVMRSLAPLRSNHSFAFGGRTVRLDVAHFPTFDQSGVLRAICSQFTDVSASYAAEEQLRLASKVFDRAGEGIVVTDASVNVLTSNDAFTRITGWTKDDVIGRHPRLWKSGKHSKDFYEAMWTDLLEHGTWQGEIINRRKNGELFTAWLTISSVLDDTGAIVNFLSIFSDISALKTSQLRSEFLATHDDLTGLPNRSLLMDRLDHDLVRAERHTQKLAVMFIDLDNFKVINDSLGHDVGDALLKQASERISRCIRDSDTLARLGGDEFVAVLTDVTLDDVNAVATRIVENLGTSFRLVDEELFVTASLGISIYPDDGKDSASLLKYADTAMYRAKESGRNQYQFFAEEMKVVALRRLTLETALRQAVVSDSFRLCFQPQIDIRSGRIVGAEALLRWHDPHLGDVPPAQFIPIAESCGQISAIGDRVAVMVIQHLSEWRSQGLVVPRISINVSPHQLRSPGFCARINDLLASSGFDADAICIELTESALMERMDMAREMLLNFDRLGTRISIDDFGTGYSSLAYLRKLPIHELKIDRSFVDGIALERDDRSIATAIVEMARALDMRVVAEGVETEAQRQVLTELGCDVAQGYLFHLPLEADNFAAVLAANEAANKPS